MHKDWIMCQFLYKLSMFLVSELNENTWVNGKDSGEFKFNF